MGAYLSRGRGNVEEFTITSENAFTFPPKSGSYFGSHYFMGGKKFETVQPEAYLFGDNSDLNYLGPRPHNLSYQSVSGNEPVRALKCFVNIRKDSLRLIRVPNLPGKPENLITNPDGPPAQKPLYNLEFTFDADCACAVAVHYNATEEMRGRDVTFTTNSGGERSDTIRYSAGSNQQFCLPRHVIDPALLHSDEPKPWNPSRVPIAIQVCAEGGPAHHSHVTYAVFDKSSDGSWSIKATKQKQAINGVCYLFQEIYGIENKKPSTREGDGDDPGFDDEDNSECVVCLSDSRDTLILPCKHLCLCSTCANQLRFQQSGCPICRQPFRALLQIRAVKKASSADQRNVPEDATDGASVCTTADSSNPARDAPLEVSVPPGYEVVPLISAINGPPALLNDGAQAESTTSTLSSSSSLRHSKRKKTPAKVEIENELTSSVEVVGRAPPDATNDATEDDQSTPSAEPPAQPPSDVTDQDVSLLPVVLNAVTSQTEEIQEDSAADLSDDLASDHVTEHPLANPEDPPDAPTNERA